MNVLDVLTTWGEPERLDYIIKEHEKLERRFAALADLLVSRSILTADDIARLRSESDTPDAAT